jgi:hypothetical protein
VKRGGARGGWGWGPAPWGFGAARAVEGITRARCDCWSLGVRFASLARVSHADVENV